MEPNTQNQNNMNSGMPPVVEAPNKKAGPAIIAVVVILLILVAALYMFGNKTKTVEQSETTQTTETENINAAEEDAQIEADLEAQLQDIEYSF